MKKLLLILLFLPMIGFGQGWIKNYNSPSQDGGGITVRQTFDNGYIIFGENVIKTNSFGDTLWTIDFTGEDGHQLADSGYIFCGYWGYYSFVRINYQGDTIWTKPFRGASVVSADDGGFVFTNSACSGNPFQEAIFNLKNKKDCHQINLFKIDSAGNLMWSKTYFPEPTYGDNASRDMIKTSDSGYMIFSTTNRIIKTDILGDTLWTKTYNLGRIYSGNQTADGGYIITGNSQPGGNHIFLLKTDSLGNQIFNKSYIPSFNCNDISTNNVIITQDGGYLISALIECSSSPFLYIIKTNSLGDTLWTNKLGNPYGWSNTIGDNIQQTNDGGYILTGAGGNSNSIGNTILIKINHLGTFSSINELSLKNNKEHLKVTDLLGRETKQTNQPLFYIYDDGTVEKRIVIE